MRKTALAFVAFTALLAPSIVAAQDDESPCEPEYCAPEWPAEPQPEPPEDWTPPLVGVPFTGFPDEPRLWDHDRLPPIASEPEPEASYLPPPSDGEPDEVSQPDGALMPEGVVRRRK